MDEAFEVVTDVAEIARLNKQLANRMRKVLPHRESREITFRPKCHLKGVVHFNAEVANGA